MRVRILLIHDGVPLLASDIFLLLNLRILSYVHICMDGYRVVLRVVFFSSMIVKLAKYNRRSIFSVGPGRKIPDLHASNTSAGLWYCSVLVNVTVRPLPQYFIQPKVVLGVVFVTTKIQPMSWYSIVQILENTTCDERQTFTMADDI